MARKSEVVVAGVGGIGFAVAIVLANLVLLPAGPPQPGADPAEVAAFFGRFGGLVGVASAVTPVAWVLAVLFGAGAVAVLGGGTWALVGFAGLLLQNAVFTGVVAVRQALAATAGEGAVGLWALHDALFTLNGTFLATAMLGLSLAGMRAGIVHRWHGSIGLCAAALQFGSALLTPVLITDGGPLGLLGLAGWLLWVGWIAAYGVVLLRLARSRDERASGVVA